MGSGKPWRSNWHPRVLLVLVGRNPLKLAATADAIREKFGAQVETRNVVIDLAKTSGEEISKTVEDAIEGLDIGVLVNNAGLAYEGARFLHEVDSEVAESIMKVNIVAATWITKAVVPIMAKKKKGAIANVGSGSYGGFCSSVLTLYTPFMLLRKHTLQCFQEASTWNTRKLELIFSVRFYCSWPPE